MLGGVAMTFADVSGGITTVMIASGSRWRGFSRWRNAGTRARRTDAGRLPRPCCEHRRRRWAVDAEGRLHSVHGRRGPAGSATGHPVSRVGLSRQRRGQRCFEVAANDVSTLQLHLRGGREYAVKHAVPGHDVSAAIDAGPTEAQASDPSTIAVTKSRARTDLPRVAEVVIRGAERFRWIEHEQSP